MRRVLLHWRGIKVHSYSAMLYLGLVFGVMGGTRAATLHGLNPGHVFAAMLLLVLPALLGARLLYVASHWQLYRHEPQRIWRRTDGGAGLYGGLVATFLVSLPVLRAFGIPIGAFWDAAAIAMLIGVMFGRVGCLLNGCCAGRLSEGPLAMHLPGARGIWCRRLPVQLFEAGLAALLLIVALAVWNRMPFDGAVFLGAVAAYGIGRWWLEAARETVQRVGPVSLHRAISAALVALSVTSLLLRWLRGV